MPTGSHPSPSRAIWRAAWISFDPRIAQSNQLTEATNHIEEVPREDEKSLAWILGAAPRFWSLGGQARLADDESGHDMVAPAGEWHFAVVSSNAASSAISWDSIGLRMDERVWSHWRAAGGHSGGSSSWRPGWGINPTFCRESCIFRTVPSEQGAKPARASRDSFEPSSCEVMASPLVTKTGRGAAAGPRNCSARGHFLFAGPRLPFAHFGERSCFAVARCLSLLGSLLTAGLLPVAGDPYGVSPSRPRPLYGVRVYCAALKSGNSHCLARRQRRMQLSEQNHPR
jgi:hypothetical protein